MNHIQTALECYERMFSQDSISSANLHNIMNQELTHIHEALRSLGMPEVSQVDNLTSDQQLIVVALSMECFLIEHGMIGPFVSNEIATMFRNEIEETYQLMKQRCTDTESSALLDALHHLVLDAFSRWVLSIPLIQIPSFILMILESNNNAWRDLGRGCNWFLRSYVTFWCSLENSTTTSTMMNPMPTKRGIVLMNSGRGSYKTLTLFPFGFLLPTMCTTR